MRQKFMLLMLTTLFLASGTIQAQKNDLPPLLDRELFFGDPEISGGQISPDGQFISFIKPFEGTRNIWVKKAGDSFENAWPVTADKERPIRGYFWSRDSKNILYVQDKGGNENFHVYAVSPMKPKSGVPESRALTSGENVRAMIYAVPKSQPDIMYVGLNERDAAWHDLYKVSISTGKKELVIENTERITSWTFDLEDNLRLASRSTTGGLTEILKIVDGQFEKIYSCGVTETCYPVYFNKDGKHFYMVTNKTDKVDLSMLVSFNLNTNALEVVEQDPKGKVDFGGAIFSDVTHELLGTTYTAAKTEFYWKNPDYKKAFAALKKEFPGKEIRISSQSADEKQWLINVFSDTDPGSTYWYDMNTGKTTFQYRPRPELPVEYMAEMKPITFTSSDGMEIPAYLTLPKGVVPKNLPLVVNPHGGPWARDYWGFNPYAQFLANRGYAVLQINFRGSTGYGKKFLNAGNLEWGQKMQDDLTWGVNALVLEGTVDPKRVAIFGGSYGGYATLAGLTFTPEVYACGVSVVGPSNLLTLLNSIPPYWESIKQMFYTRMGDPNTMEGKARLQNQSPLFSANKITKPLMVVQGANDPRVKKAESDQIVVACRELGLPVEYIVAPDEGHGFARPINQKAFIAAMEQFLSKHIGGRYQEDMPDDVADRLKEITVDPATVELPKEINSAVLFSAPPVPEKDLKAGEDKYQVTMMLQGQKLGMDLTTTIEDGGDTWIIKDHVKSMMGIVEDQSVVKKGTLIPVSRSVKQNQVTMLFDYSDTLANITVVAGPDQQKLQKDLQGSLFADGAGAKNILTSLPIKEGYKATYRNLDVQTQTVKVFEMEVVGTDKVTVPAGEFEAYKIVMKPANGEPGEQNIWVTKDEERKVIKTRAVIPQMNGAEMVAELL
ncbi:MAG: S9 family peptidase [Saprospiraceae bacterium]|nr:S9 family peptidase [Saprospiraceae bacterium]